MDTMTMETHRQLSPSDNWKKLNVSNAACILLHRLPELAEVAPPPRLKDSYTHTYIHAYIRMYMYT